MDMDINSLLGNIELRILEEFDKEHKVFVAHCLETGAVASATDAASLHTLMKETLQLEITLAVRSGDFDNLWKQQAPPDVWTRWHKAAGAGNKEDSTLTFNITLPTTPRREVKSEIRISKASINRTA